MYLEHQMHKSSLITTMNLMDCTSTDPVYASLCQINFGRLEAKLLHESCGETECSAGL